MMAALNFCSLLLPNIRYSPEEACDPNRKQAVIAIVAAIADAVSDAKRIVDRVEKSFQA
jgi:hypothetical protein